MAQRDGSHTQHGGRPRRPAAIHHIADGRNTASGASRSPRPGRKGLGESNEVLDIAEAVNHGINKALAFLGLKVEQQVEPKKPDVSKPAVPRGRLANVVTLKASPKTARKAAKTPAVTLNGKGHTNGPLIYAVGYVSRL